MGTIAGEIDGREVEGDGDVHGEDGAARLDDTASRERHLKHVGMDCLDGMGGCGRYHSRHERGR